VTEPGVWVPGNAWRLLGWYPISAVMLRNTSSATLLQFTAGMIIAT
jgi:hypothetical protein